MFMTTLARRNSFIAGNLLSRQLAFKEIEYSHAAPCHAHRNEPRNKWESLLDGEHEALFLDLIEVVRETALFGFASEIRQGVFDSSMQRNKFQSVIGSPYTACALDAMLRVTDIANQRGISGDIFYAFEDGAKHWAEADDMMKQIRDIPELKERIRYGGHSKFPKSDLLILQSADLFAWLYQRSVADRKLEPRLRLLAAKSDRELVHLRHEISEVSLFVTAFHNMFHGIKSNIEYPEQEGPNKTYTV